MSKMGVVVHGSRKKVRQERRREEKIAPRTIEHEPNPQNGVA
jgi:hypothetical protein